MPRENNPNILLKARKLPAKQDEPLQLLPHPLPMVLPLAKPPMLTPLQLQFHPETPQSEPPVQPVAKAGDWNPADQMKLSELHNQLGNRWSLISRTFPGKSDNCVKNHFFSRLRMSLRHLNKQIPAQSHIKPVKMHVLYKIMATCEERFNADSEYTQSFIDFSYQLKNKILDFLIKKGQSTATDVEKTIENIHIFNKQYKMRDEVLKIPKAARVPKPKKQRIEERDEDEQSLLSLSLVHSNTLLRNDESANDIPSINNSWNSLQMILEESLRLSEVLQLQNERVEIKMIDTSEYLCKSALTKSMTRSSASAGQNLRKSSQRLLGETPSFDSQSTISATLHE